MCFKSSDSGGYLRLESGCSSRAGGCNTVGGPWRGTEAVGAEPTVIRGAEGVPPPPSSASLPTRVGGGGNGLAGSGSCSMMHVWHSGRRGGRAQTLAARTHTPRRRPFTLPPDVPAALRRQAPSQGPPRAPPRCRSGACHACRRRGPVVPSTVTRAVSSRAASDSAA